MLVPDFIDDEVCNWWCWTWFVLWWTVLLPFRFIWWITVSLIILTVRFFTWLLTEEDVKDEDSVTTEYLRTQKLVHNVDDGGEIGPGGGEDHEEDDS